jgi:hypothetical protein
MPRRKVVLSGLLAFGAGVAVGSNWPRAGNIVGHILQRLGFELTDLSLWLWDSEKSLGKTGLAISDRKKTKRRKRAALTELDRPAKSRPKAKKTARTPKLQAVMATRETRQKPVDASEPWNLNARSTRSGKSGARATDVNRAAVVDTGLTKLDDADFRTVRRKAKTAASKPKRIARTARRGVFPGTVFPADAALN